MFIQARSPIDVRLSAAALKALTKNTGGGKTLAGKKGPLRFGVATTIQHLHKIRDVLGQLPGSVLVGQVLGCRADAVRIQAPKVDAFLYVGTGEFHPIRIALEAERAAKEAVTRAQGGKNGVVQAKPVFCYDPQAKKLFRLPQKRIDDHLKRVRGQLLRFYHANTVGLLVTTKPGQNAGRISSFSLEEKMGLPFEFMKRPERKKDGKKYYLFATETLDHQRLEDFSFIDCWVNFACNRIADDRNTKIVNAQDILDAEAVR
jgi:diphthamide biosynthesis enzyme Dph1/Dph2-like protein